MLEVAYSCSSNEPLRRQLLNQRLRLLEVARVVAFRLIASPSQRRHAAPGTKGGENESHCGTYRGRRTILHCENRRQGHDQTIASTGKESGISTIAVDYIRSDGCGPELVLGLLITLVLPEYCGAAVPHRPDVDLRRRPASSSALGAFCAKYHDPVALRENIIDLNAKCAAGQFHEMREEPEHLGVPAVVAR